MALHTRVAGGGGPSPQGVATMKGSGPRSKMWRTSPSRRCPMRRVVTCGVVFLCLCFIVTSLALHVMLATGRKTGRYQTTPGFIRGNTFALSDILLRGEGTNTNRPRLIDYDSPGTGRPWEGKGRVRNDALPLESGMENRMKSITRSDLRTSRRVEPMSDEEWSLATSSELRAQKSRKYADFRRLDGVVEEPLACEHQYKWQTTSFPACNKLHETNLSDRDDTVTKLKNHGDYVNIWRIAEYNGVKRALKSIREDIDFDDRHFDQYRRDALAMERLTASKHVLNIFGFCGVSALVEYSESGLDLEVVIEKGGKQMPMLDKLRIASQIMTSIADVHNVDMEGRASFAHTDIREDQFLLKGDEHDRYFVLNDFNRMRHIGWDKQSDKPCCFHVGSHAGRHRSPEEYRNSCETEKIDVYSAGNVLYFILTGNRPFPKKEDSEDVERAVIRGERSLMRARRKSRDPLDVALVKAIDMCWTHKPEKRPGAREIAKYLSKELKMHED